MAIFVIIILIGYHIERYYNYKSPYNQAQKKLNEHGIDLPYRPPERKRKEIKPQILHDRRLNLMSRGLDKTKKAKGLNKAVRDKPTSQNLPHTTEH